MTGADAMVKCLEAEGINLVFGYPGVAIAPFYEGLYNSGIEHVLVRQEQNAGHAASGYARMSRKPAVCDRRVKNVKFFKNFQNVLDFF